MLLDLLLNSPKNNKVMDHTVLLVRINNLSKKSFSLYGLYHHEAIMMNVYVMRSLTKVFYELQLF